MKETIMLQEIKLQPDLILKCANTNQENLKKIAEVIKNFKPTNILIAARGTSLHSGIFAKYLFQLYYHIPVAIATPSIFTIYDSEVDLSHTLVIAISQSGKGKDICSVIEKARKSNALTIGIINTKGSIISEACEFNLWNDVDEAVSYAATKTYTSTMYLITELLYNITQNEELKLDIVKVKNALEDGLQKQEEVKVLATNFKNAENTLVMARGKHLSLAMELALKIKETSHYPVNAYPCSEFYHGPIVMANKKTPTILFGIDSITNENISKMLKDLKTLKVDTLAITNKKEIADLATNSILIQNNDKYALFTAIIILQLFANELSVLRGNNPDFHEILEHIETI